MPEYANRDSMQLDIDGGYFCRHKAAMTGEGLHGKSEIADELAWRDREIDRLRTQLEAELKATKKVAFDVFGAGGPQEEQTKSAARLQSMQLALQIDQAGAQLAASGGQSSINIRAAIEQILHEGKWTDVDAILNAEADATRTPAQPGVGSTPGIVTSNPTDELEAFG